MHRYWMFRGLKIALVVVLAATLMSVGVMALWNWVIPGVIGWKAIDFWQERLSASGARAELTDHSLLFADPEGLGHELVISSAEDEPLSARSPEIPGERPVV